VSPNQNRVNAGRPEGGQYTATVHSDEVPCLSPAAQRMGSIAELRSQQLAWKEQLDFLEAQRFEVDKQVSDAATALAAIEILEVLPQAAKISYVKDGSEITFVRAEDAAGAVIVEDEDLLDSTGPWRNDRTFLAAVRRSEENLEASGLFLFDRRIDISVNDAIAKAAARLETEPLPDLATAPLTRPQRALLANAADEAYSILPEFMYGGRGEDEKELVRLREMHYGLEKLLGYDGPRA
jgi:hypothetical protein